MKTILVPLLTTLIDLLRSRASPHLEILALRQQLAMVASRDNKRHRFHTSERIFWVWLYRLWPSCLQTLEIFKPDTLVRWHRKGFRLYWTWKSRRRWGGRPAIDPDVRELIRTMSRNNIGWGAPRIHGELKMLGIGLSESTVAKYMIRHRKPPSQTWRTFLDNHVSELVSVDFLPSPLRLSESYTSMSFCDMNAEKSFTSTPRTIRLQNGLLSKSWKLSHSTQLRVT
jgi:putative transposase